MVTVVLLFAPNLLQPVRPSAPRFVIRVRVPILNVVILVVLFCCPKLGTFQVRDLDVFVVPVVLVQDFGPDSIGDFAFVLVGIKYGRPVT